MSASTRRRQYSVAILHSTRPSTCTQPVTRATRPPSPSSCELLPSCGAVVPLSDEEQPFFLGSAGMMDQGLDVVEAALEHAPAVSPFLVVRSGVLGGLACLRCEDMSRVRWSEASSGEAARTATRNQAQAESGRRCGLAHFLHGAATARPGLVGSVASASWKVVLFDNQRKEKM